MKIFLITVILFVCGNAWGQQVRNAETVVLDSGWYFSRSGAGPWLSARVPGTVHQDLIRHGLLPDPFYGRNEDSIQWVEKEDWEYKTVIRLTREQLQREAAVLNFEGLDTYADVYLNGALVLRGDNMFVGAKVPVKQLLREGENRLHIYFHSPILQTLPQWRSNGFDYPAGNDHYPLKLSVFSRKAPYSYGWDWGIRMVTCGVWRPVTMTFYDKVSIEDFQVRQLSLTDEKARLSCEVALLGVADAADSAVLTITWSLPGHKKDSISVPFAVDSGRSEIVLPVEISHPRRWMPNGWGKPVLYDFTARVDCGGNTVGGKHLRIGLRTIRVVREKDAAGESFYFEVNGIPMFAKGANYVPADAMLPAMTAERYQTLFRDIRDANMNMIRVWGGGSYEDDRFYDLADENGILVWQDFMFACTPYPGDAVFLKRVEQEVEYNIRRLRNHACLALWCGNNEIAEALKYWGWQKQYPPAVYQQMNDSYRILFMELLPSLVERLDQGRFYMHSSPYIANWGRPETWGTGDSHNWGVWYGGKAFASLDTDLPRFMSEFGFQSFPEMKTIAAFAAPEDYKIESPVMNAHQKSSIGNALIREYMQRDYRVPEKFEDFVYIGLVLQGQGIRHGMEAHRRNRPYCMGSLYWQLNDSWPVVSWSGMDYFGNWKALHYQAKRAFAPVLADAVREKDSLQLWLISDLLQEQSGMTLEMQLTDFQGKVLNRKSLRTTAPVNASVCVWKERLSEIVNTDRQKDTYLLVVLKDAGGRVVFKEPYFFVPVKDLNLPQTEVQYKILRQEEGMCRISLISRKLAKDVFIEIPFQGARFSDNFFDLLPGEKKVITIHSKEIKKKENVKLVLKHVRDTY